MKISIEIDAGDMTPYEVAWTLRALASRFAYNAVANVENVYGPYHDDVGTVFIT